MIHIKKNNVDFLCFEELLEYKNIVHAFSLKPLNFRNRKEIEEDYKKLFSALEIDYNKLVKPMQSHTDNILILKKKENKEMPDINMKYLENIDGIITDLKEVAIVTTSADCLSIILYDKEKNIIANIHSGWRGTFKKIVKKAISKMKEIYDSNPENILAFLMPAIKKCHFEVDEDVKKECEEIFGYTNKLDDIITIGRKVENRQKYNIDNILLNKLLLIEEGVLNSNIYDSGMCSVCNNKFVHSRRADGENFGLGTTVIMLK